MAQPTLTIPPDNLTMRAHVIEECVPQLSIEDLKVVAAAINRRYAKLHDGQQREALEAHYAQGDRILSCSGEYREEVVFVKTT